MVFEGNTFGGSGTNALQNPIREDLLDIITNIDPVQTPLFSMAAKVPATSTKHEWLTDTLNAVSTAGEVEGAAFSADTIVEPTRVVNWCQILRKDFSITGTMEAVDQAGISSQIGYQTEKALKELARNTEATLIQGSLAATVQGSTTTARQLKGLTDFAGNSEATVGVTAHTEAVFNNLLKLNWDDGAATDTVLASSALKQSISAFTTTLRIHHDGGPSSPNAIVKNVQSYESDFGTVDIFLERYVDDLDVGYALERQYVRVAVLRPTRLERLAKVGDAERVMIYHELTLEVLAANAVGKYVIA